MKKNYKLGLAAIAVSALLVGCGGSDTTSNPPVTSPPVTEPGTPVGTSLQNFVSGNTFILTDSTNGDVVANSTFVSDGSYHMQFYDDGVTGTCNGTWAITGEDTIETYTLCDVDTEEDSVIWEFVGELEDGMTMYLYDDEGQHEGILTRQY